MNVVRENKYLARKSRKTNTRIEWWMMASGFSRSLAGLADLINNRHFFTRLDPLLPCSLFLTL